MTPWITGALALAALAIGYISAGWQGVVLAVTVVVFALLLQFNRVLRVMRSAAGAPIGTVPSAVMLNSKLRAGMRLLDLVRLSGSLGACEQDRPDPARYRWSDAGGVTLRAEFTRGRLARWTLERPASDSL